MSDGPRPALPDERERAATLSQLLRAGGVARPDAIFARIGAKAGEAAAALRVAAIDALADHYCARFRDAAVSEGERILILGVPEPRALAAIVGALRAGLNVVLAPAALDAGLDRRRRAALQRDGSCRPDRVRKSEVGRAPVRCRREGGRNLPRRALRRGRGGRARA